MSNSQSENVHVPGTLVKKEQNPLANNLHSEASKQRLKTALDYCSHLLAQDDLISSEGSAVITDEHIQIASKIYKKIIDVLSEHTFAADEDSIGSEEIDEDLIGCDEIDEEGAYEEVEDVISSDDDYEPDEKKMRQDPDYILLDYKIRVVNLAKQHPNWNLKSLQKKGAHRLKYMRDLKVWEEHINQGGTRKDKCNKIDTWTYDRFIEARSSNQQVTTKNLQEWALSAASQFPNLEFKASNTWVEEFKRRHKIRQRKVAKLVSERETTTVRKTLATAEDF